MKILQTHELHNLPTPKLLALYRKKFKYMKSGYALITDYGTFPESLKNKDDPFVKDVTELDRYCDEIKAILDKRENVEKEKK
jgi:hypothetical protein